MQGLICNGTNLNAPPGYLPYLSNNCTALLRCPAGTQCALANPDLGPGILTAAPVDTSVFVIYQGGSQTAPSCNNSVLTYDSYRLDPWKPAVLFWDVLFWLEPEACGYGSFLQGNLCVQCPIGTFSSIPMALSNLSCLPCGAGTFGSKAGLSACAQCQPGSFTPTTALSSCSTCGVGYFQSLAGSSGCAGCGAGTYSPVKGLSSCLNCAAGTAQFASLATSCTVCASSQFSSAGDGSCSACGGSLTPLPTGQVCPVQPIPDGTMSIWLSVRGSVGDECLGTGLSQITNGVVTVPTLVNVTQAQCMHTLYVMGRPDATLVWVAEQSNLQRAMRLDVVPYNQTVYPDLCRRQGLGVIFTVRDSRGWTQTDLSGAYAQMSILDPSDNATLFRAGCYRLPQATAPVAYGACQTSIFCPITNVMVVVSLIWPGGQVQGSTLLTVDSSAQCPAPAAWTGSVQLLSPSGPYMAGDTVSVEVLSLNGPSAPVGFQFAMIFMTGVSFLSFQSAYSVTQGIQGNTLSVSGSVPGGMSGNVLGVVSLRYGTATKGSVLLLQMVPNSFQMITSDFMAHRLPVTTQGFSCRTDGYLDMLTDSPRTTAVLAQAGRTSLIQWRAITGRAMMYPTSIQALAVGNTVNSETITSSASCTSLSSSLLVTSCSFVEAAGLGAGALSAGVMVQSGGVSTVASFTVFVPQDLSVWSYPSDTGSSGRYKLFTTLRAGGLTVQNVDATPYVIVEQAPFLKTVSSEQWACVAGATGVFQIASQTAGACGSPPMQAAPSSLLVLTGGVQGLGTFAFAPSYLSSGQPSGPLLPFSGSALLSLDAASSTSTSRVAIQGLEAVLQFTGASSHCVQINLWVRGVQLSGVIPVFLPGPSSLTVNLGTTLLSIQPDPENLIPSSTFIMSVILGLGDGTQLDVTSDPRLQLSGYMLQLISLSVYAYTASDLPYVRATLTGMPCLLTQTSVRVVQSSMVSATLTCQGCTTLTMLDDPLYQQFPASFPVSIPVQAFAVQMDLIDGRVVVLNESLSISGGLTLRGGVVQAVSAGTGTVSAAVAQNTIQILILHRWAVGGQATCNGAGCAGLQLTVPGDAAGLAPFSYPTALAIGFQLTLYNGTALTYAWLPSVTVQSNHTALAGSNIPLVYGFLNITLLWGSGWALSNSWAGVSVIKANSISLSGPNILYQIHCSQLWEEAQINATVTLSTGLSRQVAPNFSTTQPFVMHAQGFFHADWEGVGTVTAKFGTLSSSTTLQATVSSKYITQVGLLFLPSEWDGELGDTIPLAPTLNPVFASHPWYTQANLTRLTIAWSVDFPSALKISGLNLTLVSFNYAPVTVSAFLQQCGTFPGQDFTTAIIINVVPSTPGQIVIGNPSGLPVPYVPVGQILSVPVFLFAPFSLQSYTLEISAPSTAFQAINCSAGSLPNSQCVVIPTSGDVFFRAGGAFLQSEVTGSVLVAVIRGTVLLNTLINLQITLIQALIDGQPIEDSGYSFVLRLGTGTIPSGQTVLSRRWLKQSVRGRHILSIQGASGVWGDTDGDGSFTSMDILFLQAYIATLAFAGPQKICVIKCQETTQLTGWQILQLNPCRNPNAEASPPDNNDVTFLTRALVGKTFFLSRLDIDVAPGSLRVSLDLTDFSGNINPSSAGAIIMLSTQDNRNMAFSSQYSMDSASGVISVYSQHGANGLYVSSLPSYQPRDEQAVGLQIQVLSYDGVGALTDDRMFTLLPSAPLATFNLLGSPASLQATSFPDLVAAVYCVDLCQDMGLFQDFSGGTQEWVDDWTFSAPFWLQPPSLQGAWPVTYDQASEGADLPAHVAEIEPEPFDVPVTANFSLLFQQPPNWTLGLFMVKSKGMRLLGVRGGDADTTAQTFMMQGESRTAELVLQMVSQGNQTVSVLAMQAMIQNSAIPPLSAPVLSTWRTGVSSPLQALEARALCDFAILWSQIGGSDEACVVTLTPVWVLTGPGAPVNQTCQTYPCLLELYGQAIVPPIPVLVPASPQLLVQKTLLGLGESAPWRALCMLNNSDEPVTVTGRVLGLGLIRVQPPNSVILSTAWAKGSIVGRAMITFGNAAVGMEVVEGMDPPVSLEAFAFSGVNVSQSDGRINATFLGGSLLAGSRAYILAWAFFGKGFSKRLDPSIDPFAVTSSTPGVLVSDQDNSLLILDSAMGGSQVLAVVSYQGLSTQVSSTILVLTPVGLTVCCNVLATFPGSTASRLAGIGTSFTLSNITVDFVNHQAETLTLSDPRISVDQDQSRLSYSEGVWTVISDWVGTLTITVTYTQPSSLLTVQGTFTASIVTAQKLVVRPSPIPPILSIHCSDVFQTISLRGWIDLGKTTVEVTQELALSAENNQVARVQGASIIGMGRGVTAIRIEVGDFTMSLQATVTADTDPVVQLVSPDYVLNGPVGTSVPILLGGVLKSGTSLDNVTFLQPTVQTGPGLAVENWMLVITGATDVGDVHFQLPVCAGFGPNVYADTRAALTGQASSVLLQVNGSNNLSLTILGSGVSAFYVEVQLESAAVECAGGVDFVGLYQCAVEDGGTTVLFAGAAYGPMGPSIDLGTIRLSRSAAWIAGVVELLTVQGGVVTAQINPASPQALPEAQGMPVVDAATLGKQYSSFMSGGKPDLQQLFFNLLLLVGKQRIVDPRLFSTDFELSCMVRVLDRFFNPAAANVAILLHSAAVPLIPGANRTAEGVLAPAGPVQDGWYLAGWSQQIPSLNLASAIVVTTLGDPGWERTWVWNQSAPLTTGVPLVGCPLQPAGTGTIVASYAIAGNGTLLARNLTTQLQGIACAVHVPVGRVALFQSSSDTAILSVTVESFRRLLETNLVVMGEGFAQDWLGRLNFTATGIQRRGLAYVNDTQLEGQACPDGYYFAGTAGFIVLPQHAISGQGCFNFSCVSGYQISGDGCVAVAVSNNLLFTCIVMLLVLVLAVFLSLCTCQALLWRAPVEDVVLPEEKQDEPEPDPADEFQDVDTAMPMVGMVILDDLSSMLLEGEFSPRCILRTQEDGIYKQ